MGSRLAETIDSVRSQVYQPIEIIVVNDGSTDPETLRYLEGVSGDGIEVVNQANGGLSSAVNTGLSMARGPYFLVLGDDLIHPHYIRDAVQEIQRDDDLGIVYCRARLFGSINEPWRLPPFTMKRQLFDNCIFATSLFRVDDWRAVGGFDETMREGREDHDFVMRILSLGRKVKRIEREYFFYRRGAANSLNDDVGSDRAKLIRAHASIFRNNLSLYADNAETFWEAYFELIDERNQLAHRYQALEKFRTSSAGSAVVSAAKGARNAIRRFKAKVARS